MRTRTGRSVIASPHGHLVLRISMVLLLVVVVSGNVGTIISQSFFDGLAGRSCCSKYGYCGTTSVGTIISQSFFDGLAGGPDSYCEGNGFYTYDAFIAAANACSGFGTTGTSDDQKRELAAFFELCYINERVPVIPSSNYCQSSSTWPCASGKSYHGRGPIQLRWNYNYGPAGQDIGFDGLNNPEKVGQDATISFKTAVWFWMNSDSHSAITSEQSFGETINAINGVECNGGNKAEVNDRVNYYLQFCRQLGVDPGTNISC